MKSPPDPHYRHRFPAEIISLAVWLYHVFSLSLRDVELLLAERGVVVSYETVRRWCKKFGTGFADRLRRRRPRPGDKWHLDEVSVRLQGVQHYLWRAVDPDGVVLDILVQPRRDSNAAKRFFKRLLKGLEYVPRVIVTDKLRSYGVAQRQLLPGVEHRKSRYLNNRAENSHRPTQRRERQMQRFKSTEQAQDFLSALSFIYGHFHPRRHQLAAHTYRTIRSSPTALFGKSLYGFGVFVERQRALASPWTGQIGPRRPSPLYGSAVDCRVRGAERWIYDRYDVVKTLLAQIPEGRVVLVTLGSQEEHAWRHPTDLETFCHVLRDILDNFLDHGLEHMVICQRS